MSGIHLSEKHGVNPMMTQCFLCLETKNELLLMGRIGRKNREALGLPLHDPDPEAPRQMIIDKSPCDTCQEYMEQGIIVISVRDGETDRDNPYRTGGWCVVKDDTFERMRDSVDEGLIDSVLKARVCILEDSVYDHFGFPRS